MRPGRTVFFIILAAMVSALPGCDPGNEKVLPQVKSETSPIDSKEEAKGERRSPTSKPAFSGPPVKVLYVEGVPRYEYRFLKGALLRDSHLLVHCLLISRDYDDFPQEHTPSEEPFFAEPLKEFPPDLKTLLNFDVVIYGDVDPTRLGPKAGEHLLQFVRDHGNKTRMGLASQNLAPCVKL